MVTINDVAKKAGVSNATASRALRRIGKIKPSTIEKVENAAKELGYIVNTAAQALKTASKKRVGLIVSDISNDYYHYIQASIESMLKNLDYELTISISSENPIDERKAFKTLIGVGVGFIFFTPTSNNNKDIIDIAIKNDIKVIQLFRNVYRDIPSIINDDEGGCFSATNYFINKGKKRILLFDVDYEYLDNNCVTPNRSIGFKKAAEKNAQIHSMVKNVNFITYDKNIFSKAIKDFNPDAIIASNGDFGFDVLKLIQNKHLNIELLTYDDNKWFELMKVSAIKQNQQQLVNTMYSIIAKQENKNKTYVIEEQLIIR